MYEFSPENPQETDTKGPESGFLEFIDPELDPLHLHPRECAFVGHWSCLLLDSEYMYMPMKLRAHRKYMYKLVESTTVKSKKLALRSMLASRITQNFAS